MKRVAVFLVVILTFTMMSFAAGPMMNNNGKNFKADVQKMMMRFRDFNPKDYKMLDFDLTVKEVKQDAKNPKAAVVVVNDKANTYEMHFGPLFAKKAMELKIGDAIKASGYVIMFADVKVLKPSTIEYKGQKIDLVKERQIAMLKLENKILKKMIQNKRNFMPGMQNPMMNGQNFRQMQKNQQFQCPNCPNNQQPPVKNK